jgi:hypothetical protein
VKDRAIDIVSCALGSVVAAAVTALGSLVLGLPLAVLAALAVVVGVLAFAVVLAAQRYRRRRIEEAARRYLNRQAVGPSELLPVGPSGEAWTSVREVLGTPGLVLPQPWRRVPGPTTSEIGDLAVATVALAELGTGTLVVGEPGIGKSLTLHRVFDALAGRFLANPNIAVLPILLQLGDAKAQQVDDVVDPRDPLQLASWASATTGLPTRDLQWLAKRGALVLLLDALDESDRVRDLRSVQALMNSPLFNTARVVSARRDFYSTLARSASVASRLPVVVELLRIPYGRGVEDFVDAYCRHFRVDEARPRILEEFANDARSRDLAERPLTLWMVVDVLATPNRASRERIATVTSLYTAYTDKWLEIETTKSEVRVRNLDDRKALVCVAARAMFQAGTALGGSARSTAELAVSRVDLSEMLVGPHTAALLASLVARHGLDVVVDETCSRTFLVHSGAREGYKFAHKSFFEYFVALDLVDSVSAGRLEIVEQYLSRPLSDPIVYFVREMLSERAGLPETGRVLLQNLLAVIRQSGDAMDVASQTVRQHAGNLAAGVADAHGQEALVALLASEPSGFVRRGVVVGLALQRGRSDLLNAYVQELVSTPPSASIHLGYTRIYHGDQEWGGRWEDDGGPDVSRTVDAQVDRLVSDRNRDLNANIWPLTLFTLAQLLEDGRGWAPLLEIPDAADDLCQFLAEPRPERGECFEVQRRRLSALLGVESGA